MQRGSLAGHIDWFHDASEVDKALTSVMDLGESAAQAWGRLFGVKDHPQIEYLQMFEKHDDGTYLRAPWKTPWGFPSLDPIE